MSKISVVAKITAQDGKRADVIAGMAAMMDHVESEEGTLKYILMRALGGAIGPLMAGRPELTFCKPLRGKGL
jgi:quinol monooxygenase YgiN